MGKRTLTRVALYTAIGMFVLYILFPFYWTVNTSLKPRASVFEKPIEYVPSQPTLDHYLSDWVGGHISQYFRNSAVVSVATAGLVVFLTVLSGYALARYRFRASYLLLLFFLVSQMIPGAVLIIPLFNMLNSVGLVNSYVGLILATTTFYIPFCTLLMRGFFAQIPRELEEAAWIDGCSTSAALFRVVFPLVLPGVVATGIFAFINAWNEFVFAAMFINDPAKMTVPIGLRFMVGEQQVFWARISASGMLAVLPPIILFAFAQRYLVQGLSAGAIKG